MIFRCFALLALISSASAECIPFAEAQKKVGETVCVTGKVLKVSTSARSGTQFLNFCDDYKTCPFTVVVFARDLRDVGDVRPLEGQTIEIHGKVKLYKGQAEIILSDSRQLRGEAAKLPALPKNYDVENQGKYSAGQYKSPTAPRTSHKKKPKDKIDTTNAEEPDSGPPPPQ
jgi:DNA/RNA endonuclease YhcR with UshA esterase domain